LPAATDDEAQERATNAPGRIDVTRLERVAVSLAIVGALALARELVVELSGRGAPERAERPSCVGTSYAVSRLDGVSPCANVLDSLPVGAAVRALDARRRALGVSR